MSTGTSETDALNALIQLGSAIAKMMRTGKVWFAPEGDNQSFRVLALLGNGQRISE
jgi:hypothetical protein